MHAKKRTEATLILGVVLTMLAHGAAMAQQAGEGVTPEANPSAFGATGSQPYLKLGPMLGHVGPEEARLWVKATAKAPVDVWISSREDMADARLVKGVELTDQSDFAGQVVLTGLEPGRKYYYVAQVNGNKMALPPYPSFTTAPAPGTRERLRFAFTSCSGYSAPDPAAGMADLAVRTNIDLFLMLGDNHYGNSPAPDKQRFAYQHQRQSSGFKELTVHTPTYGIWDDHDFGPDNSDGTMVGKEKALAMFKEHWANPAYGEPDNPGVYYQFSRGAVDFFMLDGRYYRTPNKTKDDGTKTMLGEKQVAWLKKALVASQAPVKILASGSEWQSKGTEDGWVSFLRERNALFQFIEEHHIQGVLLISGDRHFTGAYQVAQRFIEVTSGPIGGNTAKTRNLPEMFSNHGEGRHYCVYDIDTRPSPPAVTLEIYRIGTGLVERRAFTWDEVNGVTKIKPL